MGSASACGTSGCGLSLSTMAGKTGYIEIDQESCKGCGICIFFCPHDAIRLSDTLNSHGYTPASFDSSNGCTGCALCATVCPEVAIDVYRD